MIASSTLVKELSGLELQELNLPEYREVNWARVYELKTMQDAEPKSALELVGIFTPPHLVLL